MDQNTEKKLLLMVTTPRQSRILTEWNIPQTSADSANSIGCAWTAKALVEMLPDSIPDGNGRMSEFARNRIWYKGVSPIFNGEDPLQNIVDMVVWLVRTGRGKFLKIDPQPSVDWEDFLREKTKQTEENYARERMSYERRSDDEGTKSGWKRN